MALCQQLGTGEFHNFSSTRCTKADHLACSASFWDATVKTCSYRTGTVPSGSAYITVDRAGSVMAIRGTCSQLEPISEFISYI